MAPPRQQRQMLADPKPRSSRFGWTKLAADSLGRLGLRVKAVDLRQAAREEYENNRARGRPSLPSGQGTKRLDVFDSQSQQTDGTGLKGRPPTKTRMPWQAVDSSFHDAWIPTRRNTGRIFVVPSLNNSS
jgi:hypothetical protein